jgi:recombination protein RecA
MSNTEKLIEEFLVDAHKKYGVESAQRLGDSTKSLIDAIPTGSIALDVALGIGGLPRGRVVEIYGPESSGKTTLCQHIIAEAQKLGGWAEFIDMEHALDPIYAKACGCDLQKMVISQPDTGEQGLEILETAIDHEASVIVLDSVAALVPRAEIEGDFGDSHMGLQARLMSQALRKITGKVKKSNSVVIFTNQMRMKIGVMFGSPETTTGGMALRFYASVRLDMRARTQQKEDGESVAREHDITVKKNKVSSPFKKAKVIVRYGEGISRVDEIIQYIGDGVLDEFVTKAGAFYTIKTDPEVKVQGKANLREELLVNPALMFAVENSLRSKLRLPLRMEMNK